MSKYVFLAILSASLIITSCEKKGGTDEDEVITIHTEHGDMVAILFDETPKHKENFLKLAHAHFYDSLLFHRLVNNSIIQGGDPYSRRAPRVLMLGLGGPGYTIEPEFNPKLIHEKGAISAARLNDTENPTKASNGSQFFIVQGTPVPADQIKSPMINAVEAEAGYKIFSKNPENKAVLDSLKTFEQNGDKESAQKLLARIAPRIEEQTGLKVMKHYTPEMIERYTTDGGMPYLDGEYSVFGKVIKGLEVIDSIAKQPVHLENRPITDIHMYITTEKLSRAEIRERYGYVYPK